ncbi:right-handed parallel beta-helix repeat-containing protein [candidate division KSB1 bacterium]|nr:right-handed parallel beta-helix repeat-containing protein [candidate division KSB1 bacterium]
MNDIGKGEFYREGNVISGNSECGVKIEGEGTVNNRIFSNYIGTDKNGSVEKGNKYGVWITGGATADTVGGNRDFPSRNVISGNTQYGILIEGSATKRHVIRGNFIGTDKTTQVALKNKNGILIQDGATSNIIGGEERTNKNIISGNDCGIRIKNIGTTKNWITGNFIGVNLDGSKPLPNVFGIKIGPLAQENYIGLNNIQSGRGNIISGNSETGILLVDAADKNKISGNIIGTNETNATDVPNQTGIQLQNGIQYTIIRGTSDEEINVISGNTKNGVVIQGNHSDFNHIMGNVIGTDKDGTISIANGTGVHILDGAKNNIIGIKENIGKGNIISGNLENGIWVAGRESSKNIISGNYIGTDMDGVLELGNQYGIVIDDAADGNIIGGSGIYRNIISGNEKNGVWIRYTRDTRIVGNYIGTDKDGQIDLYNRTGIRLYAASYNHITNNKIWYTCDAIVQVSSAMNRIQNNDISESSCFLTGIHLDSSQAVIVSNNITKDAGDAIYCENGSSAVIAKNNIFDNAGYGVHNTDPGTTIDAGDNWWGHPEGPAGGGQQVQGNVDFSHWRSDEVKVVVAAGRDTLFLQPGSTDSIFCSLQNWAKRDDELTLEVYSETSELQFSPAECSLVLVNDTGADTTIHVTLSADAKPGISCWIYFKATSVADPSTGDTDSVLVWIYNQKLAAVSVSPDEVTLECGQKQQFSATGYDSLGIPMQIQTAWHATGGTITPSGLYTAGPTPGVYSVKAEEQMSHLTDSVIVTIVPRTSLLSYIDIIPSFLPIRTNRTLVCLATGYDSSGKTFEIKVNWWSSGGIIDSTGRFTAGPDTGMFIITAQEMTSLLCDTIDVHVLPNLIRINMEPKYVQLEPDKSQQFTVLGYGADDQPVTVFPHWSTSSGTVDQNGYYTASADTGWYKITVTDTLSQLSDSARVHTMLDTRITDQTELLPTEYALGNNYPNPFNPETTIEYSVKKDCHVGIKIYDIRGRQVAVLVDAFVQKGMYKVRFNAGNMATGVYFYRMHTKEFTAVKKMVLLE